MLRRRILAAMVFGLALRAVAADKESALDSRFTPAIKSQVGGKPVALALTGTAMRTKLGFSVYAIGSYLQQGVKVRSGDELARVAAAKQLRLIFERNVDGATMAQSFRDAIGMSHPAPAFDAELAALETYFKAHAVKRGDQILLTFVPGVGLSCQMVGKTEVTIPSPAFAQAAWEVYLGEKNLGAAIKAGLTSRL